ncbi:PREDICTED: uncharacterized protein LOC101820956 [Ficedula albicollis]|uniref:uncharacterized protein LOC101820956 n=1 Tax=Ficedula albicollis TaxID=59894 RepID=UPI00035A0941|nr:PREDICTED: uncharacterized protein LOC101820956 [Ficedula albicollis]
MSIFSQETCCCVSGARVSVGSQHHESPRRPQLGGDSRKMDPELLNLPLAVKIPVAPGTKPVFSRGKLGENLVRPYPYFNLDDPYSHHLSPAYNCLHDPHLRDYHKRKDVLQLLKRQGVITSDNKVVCTLKEFNEYRNYLTRLKLQSEQFLKQQEEGLLPLLAKLKDGPKLPGTSDTSCRRKRRLQPQKPTCPCPQKSKETPLKSGRFRKVKIASDEGQTYSRAKLGTAADSQRKRHNTAHSLFKAVLRQLTAAEAQKLQELVEIIVYKVFVRLKVPRNQRINFLRNAAQGIRGSIFSSCRRTPLDRRQKIEMVAKELLAMVLEGLGYCLEPKASKPRRAVRWKEQPVDGRATLVDKSEEDEAASSDSAHLHACLDKLTRQVVKNVRCLLKSMVASQFEGDSRCEHTKILELPKDKVSNIQMQPGISGACEGQSQEASTGVKLPQKPKIRGMQNRESSFGQGPNLLQSCAGPGGCQHCCWLPEEARWHCQWPVECCV